MKIYLIGSLRNPSVPTLGNDLRALGFEVFDDWHAGGYEADEKWREYETARGRTYIEALKGEAARHIFNFDMNHMNSSDMAVLLLPAGKSAHLEFGFMRGQDKPGFILCAEQSDRWDVMYLFASGVFFTHDELFKALLNEKVGPP